MRSVGPLAARWWCTMVLAAATAAAVAQAPLVSSQPQAPEELAAIRIAAEHFLRTLDASVANVVPIRAR